MSHTYSDLRTLYLAAAREEQPARADRRAVRAAIVAASAGTVMLQGSTAAGKLIALIPGGAKALTVGQVVAYAGIGVALGGGLAVVSIGASPSSTAAVTREATNAASHVVKAYKARPTPAAAIAVTAPTAQGVDSTPGALAAARTSPAQRAASAPASESASTSDTPADAPQVVPSQTPSLAEESRGLGSIQTALNAGDTSRALALLDLQDSEFRGGSLGQERAAARVLALCAAGRNAQAKAAQERFVSNYPGSPLIHRVQAACKK